jgi:hypothetical protein
MYLDSVNSTNFAIFWGKYLAKIYISQIEPKNTETEISNNFFFFFSHFIDLKISF